MIDIATEDDDEDAFNAVIEDQSTVIYNTVVETIETTCLGFYTMAVVTALSKIIEVNLGFLGADERYCAGAIVQKISDEMDGRKGMN